MCKPHIHKTSAACETWNGVSWSNGETTSKCPVGKASLAARPTDADGSLVVYQVAARRREIAKERGLKVYPNASKWINNEGNAKELGWSHDEWVSVDAEAHKRYEAQSGATVPKPAPNGVTRAMITVATKAANALLESLGIGRNKAPRQTREKPAAGTPRASRFTSEKNGETSKYWLNKAILDQNGNCIFCKNKFGIYVRDLEYGTIQRLAPQEEHLLPRAAGGKTVEGNIHASCGICNSTKSDFIFDGLADPRLADVIEREWKKYEVVDKTDHVCQCGVCGKKV